MSYSRQSHLVIYFIEQYDFMYMLMTKKNTIYEL